MAELPNPPIPDPTTLTTAQLEKAVDAERDWALGQLDVLRARLDGMADATTLRLKTIDLIPDRIDEKVRHLRETSEERFGSIQTQFKERDTRSERESTLNQTAVNAAFSAQKEAAAEQNRSNTLAITKSEGQTTEAINRLEQIFKTTTDALAAQIGDLKERLGKVESLKQGGKDATAGLYALAGFVAVVLSIIATVVALRP